MANSDVQVTLASPSRATEAERSEFQRLVLLGGEVSHKTLPDLLARARCLAFARLRGDLVGVGAMKRPYVTHRNEVFALAGAEPEASKFLYELGWVFITEAARGQRLASRIVETLVADIGQELSYATSRTDNHHMHSALKRFGYLPTGEPYRSQQSRSQIQLFTRG